MRRSYRLTIPITAIVLHASGEELQALDPGMIVIPTSEPDRTGLIDAMCEGTPVRVFDRDLAERSEEVEVT